VALPALPASHRVRKAINYEEKENNKSVYRNGMGDISGFAVFRIEGEVLKIKIDMWYEKKVDELPEF